MSGDPLEKLANKARAPIDNKVETDDLEKHLGESAAGHDKLSEADKEARKALFERADLIMQLSNQGLIPALDAVLEAKEFFVAGKDALVANPDRDKKRTFELSESMAKLDRALAKPVTELFIKLYEAGDIPDAAIKRIQEIYSKKNGGGAEKK